MPRTADDEPPEKPQTLLGYRLRHGFVLFDGVRHRTIAIGTEFLADDPIVPKLFQKGADIEPVMG